MSPANSAENPFGEIALCLSGGGYRAAAFHLGVLSMLDDLGLLENVKYLSTASGGTICAAYFALQTVEGKPFPEIYKGFYRFLKKTNVIDEALKILYPTAEKTESNHLSLIRCAAEIYSREFVGEVQMNKLFENTGKDKRFNDLVFNSTDFKMGNSFRFRSCDDQDVKIGNKYFNIKKDFAKQILLADVVAASSCFPGAFEPFRFPEDFRWASPAPTPREVFEQYVDERGNKTDKFFVSVPLMDGGIYDNRGMYSMILADDRMKDEKIGLFIISDTDRRNEDMLNFPITGNSGWITLAYWWWILLGAFILSLVSAFALVISYIKNLTSQNPPGWFDTIFVYLLPFALMVFLSSILFYLYQRFQQVKKINIGNVEFEIWNYAKVLTLPDLITVLKARVDSALALMTDIFMKANREMSYRYFNTSESRKKRLAYSLIYDFTPNKPRLEIEQEMPEILPNEQMIKYSKSAQKMATTLWFDSEETLKEVIICGQLTACFSLLKYLFNEHKKEIKDQNSPYFQIFEQLKEKWAEFKETPEIVWEKYRY